MDDPYAEVKKHFKAVAGVTVNEGRGAQGIKLGKRMFCMFYKGDLLIQLSPDRVRELIESGDGLPADPGTGTPMKDRVIIPSSAAERWIEFTEESRQWMSSR